jgi:hypothetical protein
MAPDKIGITMLHPTKTGEREWFCKLDDGNCRTISSNDSYVFPAVSGFNRDPYNPEFFTVADDRTDGKYATWFIDGRLGIATAITEHDPTGKVTTTIRPYIMDYKDGIMPWEYAYQTPPLKNLDLCRDDRIRKSVGPKP